MKRQRAIPSKNTKNELAAVVRFFQTTQNLFTRCCCAVDGKKMFWSRFRCAKILRLQPALTLHWTLQVHVYLLETYLF